jgi:hypothetical protein
MASRADNYLRKRECRIIHTSTSLRPSRSSRRTKSRTGTGYAQRRKVNRLESSLVAAEPPIAIAQDLRPLLKAWRDDDYPGASDTNALRKAAADSADVISMGDQGFGETFEIRFSLATDKGHATVLSGWIVRRSEDFPRLVTCFIV